MQTNETAAPIEALVISAAKMDITVTAAGPGAWRLVSRSGRAVEIRPNLRGDYIVKMMGNKNRPSHTEVIERYYGDAGALCYALGQLRAAARQDAE